MKRLHLFETHDQAWCPAAIRDAETDYLQFIVTWSRPYAAILPKLADSLQRAGARHVLDLCSGAGGPWPWLQPRLAERGAAVTVRLSDRFPNGGRQDPVNDESPPAISYHPLPVEATEVPETLHGFRTLFSSFHHLRPEQAGALLADTVRRREGIAIFEGSHRSARGLLLGLLVPLMVLVFVPFIRPFRWSRLLWTYLVPVVPLDCGFAWVVSCLRTYTVRELREMTERLGPAEYDWDIGEIPIPASPIPITYLIGLPRRAPGLAEPPAHTSPG